jgi:hypothetical protein
VELYWHAKTMVAQGMLPKEQDYRKFGKRLEALESQNKLLLTMVSWLVKHNGGSLQLAWTMGFLQISSISFGCWGRCELVQGFVHGFILWMIDIVLSFSSSILLVSGYYHASADSICYVFFYSWLGFPSGRLTNSWVIDGYLG